MNNITINCGNCGKLKGCQIRKDFVNISEQYPAKYNLKFKLKCNQKEIKYKFIEGQKVTFTVGFGVELWNFEWEWENDHHYGTKVFENRKYLGYVEFDGIIHAMFNKNKCFIKVLKSDFIKSVGLFNELDLKTIYSVSESLLNGDYLEDNKSDYIYFSSKVKFIQAI